MNAIIQHFQDELTPEERALFEANARLHGRRPGEHLKALIFGSAAARTLVPARSAAAARAEAAGAAASFSACSSARPVALPLGTARGVQCTVSLGAAAEPSEQAVATCSSSSSVEKGGVL